MQNQIMHHLPCVELRQINRIKTVDKISEPIDAVRLLHDRYKDLDREQVMVLNLNAKCSVLNYNIVSIGCLTSSIVELRELFKSSILSNAAHILVLHNHPSGDLTPSADDIRVTKRLIQAGALLGIPVLDHIIIGQDQFYYSFQEHGTLEFKPKCDRFELKFETVYDPDFI